MQQRYKVFDKGFNKVLDLIEESKSQAVDAYKCLVEILPDEILEQLEECEEFLVDNKLYSAGLCSTGNSLHFEFTRNYNYLKTMIKVHRIFEKELEENNSIELFEIIMRNTPKLKVSSSDFKYRCNVFLNLEGFDYFIVNQEVIKGKIYTTKTPISYDEIQMCFETEEEYVPDLEFEINPDFDV